MIPRQEQQIVHQEKFTSSQVQDGNFEVCTYLCVSAKRSVKIHLNRLYLS